MILVQKVNKRGKRKVAKANKVGKDGESRKGILLKDKFTQKEKLVKKQINDGEDGDKLNFMKLDAKELELLENFHSSKF